MGTLARADLESFLRARNLDRTLVPARPAGEPPIPTGLPELDAALRGGFPRGELSEIVGPRSSGRTSTALAVLGTAVAGGEVAALIDAFDRFDPPSAAAFFDRGFEQLLWVRGETGSIETAIDPARAVERAVKAFNLVLQAGGFAVAALDVADAPSAALRRLPFTTWFRLARAIEGGRTVALLIAPEHLARSPGGVTIALDADPHWVGLSRRARIFAGLRLQPRVPSSSWGDLKTDAATNIRLSGKRIGDTPGPP
jgi:recombination protein RecA